MGIREESGSLTQNRGREVFMKRVQLEGEAGENEGGNGMLIEADRYPTLYTSRTAQRRAQPPPNLPDRRRIFPDQTSGGPRPRPAHRKVGRLGGCAQSAHSIFRRVPARLSARARRKCVETCSPGLGMPYTWPSVGTPVGLCVVPPGWRASCGTLYSVFLTASTGQQRQ